MDMTMAMAASGALLIAYLLGAIPFGLMIASARGVDLRNSGSKNIGATNVFRCVGAKWGILAFVLDMLKGLGGVYCAYIAKMLLSGEIINHPDFAGRFLLLQVLCGTAAMLGHIFPVYLKFKGGKGISTALGLLFGVAPLAAITGFGGWIVLFLLSRYVSLASCLAAVIVGACMWSPLYAAMPCWYKILISTLALLAILKHTKNIVRLCNGTENRFAFTAKQRAARDAKLAAQAKKETNA
jgi:glycerol-3-phosphate acyltransferase PlsY